MVGQVLPATAEDRDHVAADYCEDLSDWPTCMASYWDAVVSEIDWSCQVYARNAEGCISSYVREYQKH